MINSRGKLRSYPSGHKEVGLAILVTIPLSPSTNHILLFPASRYLLLNVNFLHLLMYLKEKRELAEQTSGVFKVCVAGLRNERRVIGDEVR